MASGVSGRPLARAAKHAGLGYRSTGGGVTVPHLEEGGCSALARQTRRKHATISHVEVGQYDL